MTMFVIEPMRAADATAVLAIYAEGIAGRLATFETAVPDWQTFDAGKRPDCRLVARGVDGGVLGWAALSPVSKRACYAGVAEVSVYVTGHGRGLGIGKALLAALIAASEQAGVWTLTASIFPENSVSVALHQQLGFKLLGRRERIAQLDGVWRDTLVLERRSTAVGWE